MKQPFLVHPHFIFETNFFIVFINNKYFLHFELLCEKYNSLFKPFYAFFHCFFQESLASTPFLFFLHTPQVPYIFESSLPEEYYPQRTFPLQDPTSMLFLALNQAMLHGYKFL